MASDEPHAIENAREVLRLRAELEQQQEAYADLQLRFDPLCPCHPADPEMLDESADAVACPIHDDGGTFVAYVLVTALRALGGAS